jgi:hypothetical protein
VLALLLAEYTREEIAQLAMCSLSAVRGVMARMAPRLGDASALAAARRLRQGHFSSAAILYPSRGGGDLARIATW